MRELCPWDTVGGVGWQPCPWGSTAKLPSAEIAASVLQVVYPGTKQIWKCSLSGSELPTIEPQTEHGRN